MMEAVRLFVGGLPPDTTPDDLSQRFAPFGVVQGCTIAPPKAYAIRGHVTDASDIYSRNFGYVTLEPKDEHSLNRAVQVYTGAKWRGCTLRCQIARPSGVEIVQQEIQAEQELASQPAEEPAPMRMAEAGTTLRIRKPWDRELVPVTLGGRRQEVQKLAKTEGAPASNAAAAPLWQALDQPQGDRYGFERLLQVQAELNREPDSEPNSDDDDDGRAPAPKRKLNTAAAKRNAAKQAGKPGSAKRLPAMPPPKRLRTVDFMAEDEKQHMERSSVAPDLSRFGGDSSDEGPSGLALGQTIPQTDGAADSPTSSDASTTSSEASESSSATSADASQDADPSNADGVDSDGADAGEVDSGSDAEVAAGEAKRKHGSSSSDDDGSSDSGTTGSDAVGAAIEGGPAAGRQGSAGVIPEEEAPWLKGVFPAGAAFFRSVPLVKVEAAWRAGREAAVRDYREKRRQAIRHVARPAGGGKRAKQ